jgi:hypothetical protein
MSEETHPVTHLELRLPTSFRVSPDLPQARSHNIAWLTEYGVLHGATATDRYLAMRIADGAAWTFPDARGDGLALIVDWASWINIFDDALDSTPIGRDRAAVTALCGALLDPDDRTAAPASVLGGLVHCYRDIRRREREGMSQEWQARCERNWHELITAYAYEAAGQGRNIGPGIGSYLEFRRMTISFTTLLDLACHVGCFEVPEAVFAASEFEELMALFLDVTTLTNDFYSWRKEERAGHSSNLVMRLASEQGRAPAETAEEVGRLVQQALDRYRDLREKIIPQMHASLRTGPQGREATRRYVDTMNSIVQMNEKWGRESGRFASTDDHYLDEFI